MVMTDHLIQRRPPPGDLLAELPERHPTEAEEYRGEVVPYDPRRCRGPGRTRSTGRWPKWPMKNNLRAGVVELARQWPCSSHARRSGTFSLATPGWPAANR